MIPCLSGLRQQNCIDLLLMAAIGVRGSSTPLLSCFHLPFVQSKFLNAFYSSEIGDGHNSPATDAMAGSDNAHPFGNRFLPCKKFPV